MLLMKAFASLVRVLAGVNAMRRSFVLVSILVLGAGSAPAARMAPPAPTGSATFVVTGHGWGHGVGLSQYGAYGYAQKGFAYAKILQHYFPGTALGPATISRVRVLLTSGAKSLTVGSQADFRVRDGSGAVHDVVAGTYALGPALKLPVDGQPAPRALPGPLLFQPGAAPLALKHPYRGTIQVDVPDGALRAINFVGLEQYLYGVVPSEMPFTWHPEALKAQAVAARSYALATRRSGAFDVYPDTRSQVYLGLDHERPSTNAAVDATAGKVVLFEGQVARTYFFSTSGGRTASAQDVWGEAIPYLVSVPDPYDTISPYHDWGPFSFTGAKLARMMKMPGRVVDLQSEVNGSGRVKTLTAVGTRISVSIAAKDVRHMFGLRSTWFSVGVLSLSAPPATVVFGARARLNGIARGLPDAVLQQQDGADWQEVGAVKADGQGAVSVVVKPGVTTRYRLASGKVVAPSVRVPVAPLVRLMAARTPDQLRGSVRPLALAGSTVFVQRQDGTRWLTLLRASVEANGRFLAKLQLTTGVYRAFIGSGHGFVAGTSPILQVSTS
jgi:stage II sporulation protein D